MTMEGDEAQLWASERMKAMQAPPESHRLLTSHLGDDVVAPDANAVVWTFHVTDPDDGRRGYSATALRLGDRDNPDLTPDEAEYVASLLLNAAAQVWRRYGDGRDPVTS